MADDWFQCVTPRGYCKKRSVKVTGSLTPRDDAAAKADTRAARAGARGARRGCILAITALAALARFQRDDERSPKKAL